MSEGALVSAGGNTNTLSLGKKCFFLHSTYLVADKGVKLVSCCSAVFLLVLGQLVSGRFFEAEFNMGLSCVFVRRG